MRTDAHKKKNVLLVTLIHETVTENFREREKESARAHARAFAHEGNKGASIDRAG
jgi:hypothetical protein